MDMRTEGPEVLEEFIIMFILAQAECSAVGRTFQCVMEMTETG